MSAADREVVEQAVRQLGVAELKLSELIGQVTAAPSTLKRLLDQIAEIAGAAYLIGAHGGMTDNDAAGSSFQVVGFSPARASASLRATRRSMLSTVMRRTLPSRYESNSGRIS
jgi:hypothetical protein